MLEGLEAIGDDCAWWKEELEEGVLKLFQDQGLAAQISSVDFARLRAGAYASAVPPPGWTPQQVPQMGPAREPQAQHDNTWICGCYDDDGTMCQEAFTSFKDVKQHRLQKHGFRDPWACTVITDTCPRRLSAHGSVAATQKHVAGS
eukprot:5212129-Pyramimonas_sp.AAC.1